MTTYRLVTLGRVELLPPAGAEAVLRPGKPLALLVYLALNPAGATREHAASLLWSRSGREAARQSLRQALSVLRKLLGADAFTGDGQLVLRPGLVVSDLQELERVLAAGDVDALLKLWRGPFLADFVVPDAPEWEEWSEAYGGALARRVAFEIVTHARGAAERGEHARATSLYRSATAVNPLAEDGWTGLVGVLLDSGNRHDARAALAAARDALAHADTSELRRLADRLAAVEREASPGEPGLRLEFGGRAKELLRLRHLWQQARAGRLVSVALSGPPGMGKSRLLQELAAGITAEGGAVVMVSASRAELHLEYAMATALVRRLLSLRGAAGITVASDHVLRSLLPSTEARPTAGSAGPPPAIALGDALGDLLAAVSEESPLLLAIEDMHWADPASRNLLRYVQGRLENAAVLVLTTFREDDVPPEVHAELPAVFAALHIQRIDLQPLAAAELEGILAQTLEGLDLEPQELARLATASAGNPRFLEEVLKTLQETGALVHGPGGLAAGAGAGAGARRRAEQRAGGDPGPARAPQPVGARHGHRAGAAARAGGAARAGAPRRAHRAAGGARARAAHDPPHHPARRGRAGGLRARAAPGDRPG